MSRDVYASVTARIMDALAQGVVPWRQPWDGRQGLHIQGRDGRRRENPPRNAN